MQPQQQGVINNNQVNLIGRVASEFVFSHEVFGEGFYIFNMEIQRLSDNADILPVTISDRLTAGFDIKINQAIAVTGQIRSYNSYVESENHNRLVLTVFAKDFTLLDSETGENPNEVFLNGYVCKPPVYRTTPFGREIADILLAVNRSYNKSDYIPCIAWGRNARFTGKLAVGDNIRTWGRMQSRVYQKKQADGTVIERTAYEVSIAKMEFDPVKTGTEESDKENSEPTIDSDDGMAIESTT